jgi:hypothetical protein
VVRGGGRREQGSKEDRTTPRTLRHEPSAHATNPSHRDRRPPPLPPHSASEHLRRRNGGSQRTYEVGKGAQQSGWGSQHATCR